MKGVKAICFGEVLVDQFPTGDKPGGAPMNVAYHMTNLGTNAAMLSSIGNDEIGEQLMEFMKTKHLDTSLVQTHPALPTGTVQVNISDKNEAKYIIVEPVAWDAIEPISDISGFASVEYIVHGSLALRSEQNRISLKNIKSKLRAKAVFDLNLRPPFYSKELLLNQMHESAIVKLNEEEFELVAEWMGVAADESGLAKLLDSFPSLEMLLVTMGGKGAWVQTKSELTKSSAFKVEVVETVGAGDSFLGSFIHGLNQGWTMQDTIDFAAATGALVASKSGANPEYSEADVRELMKR